MAKAKRKRRRPDKPDPMEDERESLPSSSGFDAEFRCPGKRALCKSLPKEEDTAVTARGRRIHEALQEGDFSQLAKSEGDTASRIAYGESEIVHEFGFEGALIEFEQRVWDVDDNLNHTWSGRIDRYDWQPDQRRLLVIDDKTGWTTPPPVHMNWQVRSEASLLAEQNDAEEVVVALIHPHHAESLWEAKVYTRRQCDTLLETTRHLVKQIQMPNQRRIPGGIQCQWCQAKRVCPEFIAEEKALDQAIADEITDQGFTAINARSKEERGEHVRQLKARVKNIEFLLSQYVELNLRDPDSITGWRLTRRVTRHIVNEVEAMNLVRAEYGPDVLYSALHLSVKALEDELAKNVTRKEAKAAVERVIGAHLRSKKGDWYLTEARSL